MTEASDGTETQARGPAPADVLLRRIRFWIAAFVVGLVFSGLTAFP
jgi:hypothetical protein